MCVKYFTIQNTMVVRPCPWELQCFNVNFVFHIFLSTEAFEVVPEVEICLFLYLISQLWVCVTHSAVQFGGNSDYLC